MAKPHRSLQKRKHFLDLIDGVPPEKILFCPIDISKHFHVALFHDLQGRPLEDFFAFSASRRGGELFMAKLQQHIAARAPERVFIGMEPTNVYYENLFLSLHQRWAGSLVPKVQLGLVDPAAVSSNRKQHSVPFAKDDYMDCAAIGELLTRGLYTPARVAPAVCIRIKELSRCLKYYRNQQLRLWNRFLSRLDRVFPNLLIDYQDEKPLCQAPAHSKLLDDLLHICPDPYRLLELSPAQLIQMFHQQGRPLGLKRAQKIHQAAARALRLPPDYQAVHLELLAHERATLDTLRSSIRQISQTLQTLIQQTPARHLLAIAGNSEKLTAELVAGLEDWHRYPSIAQVWAAAGLAPVCRQSGSTASEPHLPHTGSAHLRQAIYTMTATIVWHEPTFGIPCFERLLRAHPFVPTILHVGRKLIATALAILRSDQPFRPPFADYAAAHARLAQLQQQYLARKKKAP